MVRELKAGKLQIKIYASRTELGSEAAREAADKIRELLKTRGELNMIFAAAPSQNEFLDALILERDIEWSRVTAFHMDEYIGLQASAPQVFGNYLRARIFTKLPFKSVNYINPAAQNTREECERYAGLLSINPVDIVCMGIGENGHIAFNDPGVARFDDPENVKIVTLDERCRQQQVNDGCFESIGHVPINAITLTIPALFACKYIFCMVPGRTKAEAVKNTSMGDISELCPATILRTHENAVLYADIDSASGI